MNLRIFADENVPTLVVHGLRDAGHDVTWSCEYGEGASDDARLAEAFAEGRVILTEDNDFARLVLDGGKPLVGLIRFDLYGMKRDTKSARILFAAAARRASSLN